MSLQKILSSRLTTLALIAVVTVLSLHVVSRATEGVRADLTSDDLYSLSDGSEMILARMQQEGVKPIELKLYFSQTVGKSLPRFIKDFVTYEKYLRALLREFETASEGKVVVRVIDPLPDSDDAQDALDYGLDGKSINQHGDLFFFGLVFVTQTGSKDAIEFLWPNQQETIEYEISKRVHQLIWPNRQRIGVLSSLAVLSDASNPYMAQILRQQGKDPKESWLTMQLLEESYQVSKIESDVDHISRDDFDLVLVVHPKNLPEKALFALDEWVTTGGNALIFLDPYAINDQPPQNPQQPWMAYQYDPSSNLERLLDAWGLQRQEGVVAADFDLAVTRQVSLRGAAERLIVDLEIDEPKIGETLAEGHPMLQGLATLRFLLAGSLKAKEDTEDAGTQLTPLITTTAQGNTLAMKAGFPSGEELVFNDTNNPAKLLDAFTPGDAPVVLAYELQGRLGPAFAEGGDFPAETPAPPPGLPPGIELPPPAGGEMIHKDPVPEEARQAATVMVFADVDMIADVLAFQQGFFGTVAANDNYKLLLNAVDYLLGSEELMKVRAKKPIRRPFTLFDEIEAKADRETLERERQLRAEVEGFQEELQQKQSGLGARNASLFQKQVQDEVDELNERIKLANGELREIRKQKRAALEGEEAKVRFTTLWLTPAVVLLVGFWRLGQRRRGARTARRSKA